MNTSLQLKIATDYWVEKAGRQELIAVSPVNTPAATETRHAYTLIFQDHTAAALKKVCNDQDTAIYAFLATGLFLLLHKYTGADSLLAAGPAPVLSGGSPSVSPLFLSAQVLPSSTVRQLLQSFQEELKAAYRHRDYPFEKFTERYETLTGPVSALFNYSFSYLPLTGKNIYQPQSLLAFDFRRTENSFALEIQGAGSYAPWFITQMATHLESILQVITAQPAIAVAGIDFLSAAEKQLLLETFNDTAVDYPEQHLTVSQLFEKQAALHPAQPAVVYGNKTLSYSDLQRQALQVATLLKERNIGKGDVVALVCDRSEKMITGMLGILKSGAAYLPVDANYPDDRIHFILQDSQAKMILTTQQVMQQKTDCFRNDSSRILLLDSITGDDTLADFTVAHTPDDTAYIIYSSGSTGRPKGIAIKQGSATNLVLTYPQHFRSGINITDRVLALANISFDASIVEFFMTLASGATLVVLDEDDLFDAGRLATFLKKQQITHAYIPPVLLKDLYDQLQQNNTPIALNKLFVGVEAIKDTLLYNYCTLIPGLEILNAYGPAETTVFCSALRYEPLPPAGENVSIGKPVGNQRVYILNDALQPVPAGVPGEICIAGAGVASGYLNNEALTAEKFVADPFHSGQKMYRSGDLGRWTQDGNIIFIGRKDNQVKIRGYRIEPGEIASVLLNHPAVDKVVVGPLEDEYSNKYLCAWIVPSGPVVMTELHTYLAGILPEYMIPARFMLLKDIPVTANGKTDMRRLPRPEEEVRVLTAEDMPADALEERLLAIWQELLHVSPVSVKDNFFQLGGHSLKAARLITIILRELQVEIPLRQMFVNNSIRQLAAFIRQTEKAVQLEIPVAADATQAPASFAQTGLYLSYMLNPAATNYNVPSILQVKGEVDTGKLEAALQQLIARHAVLRTSFSFTDETIRQHISTDAAFSLSVIQDAHPDPRQYFNNFVRPFELSQAPLLRGLFIQQSNNAGFLLLDTHHIICDGISMEVFLQELMALYHGEALQPLKIQFHDYAAWLQQYSRSHAFEKNRQYWMELFADKDTSLELPADYPRSKEKNLKGGLHLTHIDKTLAAQLKQFVNEQGSSLFLLTLAAYNLLLSSYSGKQNIVVGTPVAGRIHPDLDHLLGMFVNTLPVKSSLDPQQPFPAFLEQLRNTFFTALDHQLYPMDELAEKLELVRTTDANPLFGTIFSYRNAEQHPAATGNISLHPVDMGWSDIGVKADISASVVTDGEEIALIFSYAKSLFRLSTIEKMAENFIAILRTIATAPSQTIAAISAVVDTASQDAPPVEDSQAMLRYLELDENIYEDAYPLNATQRDVAISSLLDPENYRLRMLYYFDIYEPVAAAAWEAAMKTITQQEVTMRSALITKESTIYQAVLREGPLHFQYDDISGKITAENSILSVVEQYGESQDLELPYFKHYLLKVSDQHYIALMSAHHVFTDGITIRLMFEKAYKTYQELQAGLPVSLTPQAPFRVSVMEQLAKFDTAAVETYWRQRLSAVQPLTYNGALATEDNIINEQLEVNGATARQISQYCAQHGIQPHLFFKAAFTLLTRYYCGADYDFCIRENIAGRNKEEMNRSGTHSFVYPLLIERAFFTDTATFPELCAHLYQQKKASGQMRFISLGLQNSIIGQEKLSFYYNYQHFIVPDTASKTGVIHGVYHILDNQLELRVLELPDGFTLKLDYNEKIFSGAGFLHRLQHIFSQVLQTDMPLREVQYLHTAELQQLHEMGIHNGSKTDKNIPELFAAQVKRHPDNVAVVFKDQQLTYAALDKATDAVAAYLQQQGITAGDIVGIMVDRSEWMIVGVLGVLKAGAAYLPIDTSYPPERIRYMLEDCATKVLLTQSAWTSMHPSSVLIEEISATNARPAPVTILPEQLAYVIYTSGTTGNPKGVMVEHRALSNIDHAWRMAYQLDTFTPRLLQMAGFSFDVFTGDVVRILSNGGCLVICPAETRLDPASVYDLLSTHGINVLESTPALVMPLMDYIIEERLDLPLLKLLIVGSDTISLPAFKKLVDHLSPGIRVLNSYGVTETCIDAGFYETTSAALPAAGNTPVGKPLVNYSYFISNALQQRALPGQAGELWIGGTGVARGYINKPEITAQKFITDPYTRERVYRTGDLARWLPDGNLEFIGRSDNQVKVRGFRIELQEIENALLRDPEIREVVVTVYGAEQEKELVCWYVSHSGNPATDIKNRLQQQLPEHMIPSWFIPLEQLPVTHNGKVDRKALQDPLSHIDQQRAVNDVPATPAETMLLAIWQDILKRNKIGVHDNFFEMGGQSLRAMVLVSRIRKATAANISLKDIFRYPTISKLAAYIDQAVAGSYTPIPKAPVQEYYPLSSAQKRVFVISHFKGAEISHNICGGLRIQGPLDADRLEAAFQAMTDRHESLRTAFVLVNDEPVQVIHDHVNFHLERTRGSEADTSAATAAFIRSFNLAEAPLLRAAVMEISTEDHLLLYDIHHIISDEVSTGNFFRELWALYNHTVLPALSVQYKDYVAWQQTLSGSGLIAKQKQYWLQQLQGELPVIDLPSDTPRPLAQTFDGNVHVLELSEDLVTQATGFIAARGITMNMLMLAVYNILVSKYTSLEDIVIGTPVAGRTHADLEQVIGMFVNTLAIRSYPSAEKTFEDFLLEIKTTALAAFENQDYPFEELVESLQLKRDPSRNPVFDLLFQFISHQPVESQGALSFRPHPMQVNIAKFDLTFFTVQSGSNIALMLNYNTNLFTEASMQRLAHHFRHILTQVLAAPQQQLKQIVLADEAETLLLKAFGGSPDVNAPRLTIPEVWKEIVQQHAAATAVETTSGSITFGELDEKSTALAICLQETYQVKTGDKVALMLQRTTDMPVTLMAILKTGAAYVPVDPQFPAQRIEYILSNSGCTMIVADKDYSYSLPLLNIHTAREATNRQELLPVNISPDDLAYIIYTSGSTGVPKGAMLEHVNLTSFVRNLEPVYGFRPGDKMLAISNITFDLSVMEILGSLLTGVCVLLAGDEELNDFPKIVDMIRTRQVNIVQMTPSRFLLFLQSTGLSFLHSVKTVVTGGEPVPRELFRGLRRYKHLRVFTSCGPTETTIYSTTDEVKDDRITIGKPLLNEQVLIVGDHGQLQPINVVGEIYIAGSGVGRGYCNQEALTAEKFFRDENLSAERIYKSGDLGRWLADGRIECIGRKDTQIKLKGYRIELGEIENALAKMENIRVTAAIITTVNGEKQIATFYESEREYGYSTVRAFLADLLPSYMLPLFCIRVEKMPLTSSGKIDRKALDVLAQQQQAAERPFEEPAGPIQKALAAIWKDALQLERVGTTDNFFELGGNSIKLIQVLNRIKKELDVNIPLTTAFTYPTIKALAEKITMINEFGSVSAEEFYSVVNPGKEKTIFFFPPAIGYSFIYTALAEYFPDYTLCCFHFFEQEDRTAQYIQVMQELQPEGPLTFAGYSAGGNFAFEITKDTEAAGREVSDLIMIDSYCRHIAKAKTKEELDATVEAYYRIVDWSIFSVTPDYLETLKKNTMSKIAGYTTYMNGKTDDGTTNAHIHLLMSKEEWKAAEVSRNWSENSTSGFHTYDGTGLHPEMFNPEFITHNAGVIAGIMQQIQQRAEMQEHVMQ
ncbi:amino acid adenylation domain-containing protein [Chitinophaga sp. Mgbs1]|uniref:Amino acid adenylation domain-containing protein n=1 Tax=Chitinophaga solisilvae TaxID=1233460 RepID=A0A3S1B1R5_9BACT|nr:amino acid adenylation domain-containing protein [Chitinophaga solisilvae]